MDFHFTAQQQEFADTVRRFARNKLAAGALERAHTQAFPWDVAKQLSEIGLLGITLKEEDGGMGGSLMDAVIAIRELALVCPKSADVVQAGSFGAIRTFAEYGTAEQKARYLPDLLAGRALLALGMSEPDAGSAVTDLKTSAREEGDEVVINGSKVFSTNSPDATLFLVYVRFGPGVGGIGSVLIERGAPGFEIGKPSAFMSGEEWCQLYFNDCRIPKSNILLGPGGFKKQIAGFNVERIGNAARAVGAGAMRSNWRRNMRARACSSADPCASSRGCSGSSRTWRSSSNPPSCCSTARPRTRKGNCRPPMRRRSPSSHAILRGSRPPTNRCRSWAPMVILRKRSWNIA